MNAAISINTKPFQFDFKHLLILVLVLASLFFLSNYFVAKKLVENTHDFNYEDIAELAEEIYDSETLEQAIKKLLF